MTSGDKRPVRGENRTVIVTTRSSEVSIGRRMKVGKLEDVRDSLQILSDASHREGVMDGEWFEILYYTALWMQCSGF